MRSLLPKLLAIIAGIAFALVMLTGLLMLFPSLIFGATDYYQRTTANQTTIIEYKHTDGDLFVALPGRVRPPEDNPVLASVEISWDENGFRQPLRFVDSYPIATFGDSFTESVMVQKPWSDGLAELLDTPVKNYGYRAYGPQEIKRAIEEFAAAEERQWVIYGYFSGNDLGDSIRPPKVDVSTPMAAWSALLHLINPVNVSQTADPNAQYDYPMPVIIGGNYYEIALLPYYLWWQTAPDVGFEASENFRRVLDVFNTMDEVLTPEICRALVFIPTKEQLYYPYIYETERQWVRNVGQTLKIAESGEIWMDFAPISEAEEALFITRLTDHRDAIQKAIEAREGWLFVDLLPDFENAVAEGQLLYYPYDSHWNQAGHDLAAQILANALINAGGCEQ